MTRKNHFYYDSDRCEFVPIEYDLKKKLIHSFSFWLINGIVLAAFGIALLSNYVGTPAEIMLKDENQALVEQLKLAETSITDIENQLESISQLDNEMYRTILGLDPVTEDLRMAGTGGSDAYSEYDYYSEDTAAILRSTASKLDRLERRLGVQKVSFAEVKKYYSTNRERLKSIPAIRPVNGIIISGYGMRIHPVLRYKRMHEGIDFRADIATDVYATGDGVIKFAGRNGTFGNLIEIDHGFGFVTRYAHLSSFVNNLKVGQEVKRGELIGFTGNSGLTEGPHLHYEVLVNNRPIDPLNYLIADVTPEEYLLFKRNGSTSTNEPLSYIN
ncbi:M23 family metallopeptidase [Rhodohalobacter sulfatireducens]|uniref:M23 family metallopeptidase n=1 Tax=Rhodohalobacter sulfatireducens TaxID=2911366 RepID=A0ABS9KB30_9BACT|nr:M23 family metallopeptidase [Rhodohalobacter sulfatireducens]MCG2588069.1 M23 family metallopeptidase [Rhodohalobacter sulfatireducens]